MLKAVESAGAGFFPVPVVMKKIVQQGAADQLGQASADAEQAGQAVGQGGDGDGMFGDAGAVVRQAADRIVAGRSYDGLG
jgi:hypothetical protein